LRLYISLLYAINRLRLDFSMGDFEQPIYPKDVYFVVLVEASYHSLRHSKVNGRYLLYLFS